jgi:hypothetical protein
MRRTESVKEGWDEGLSKTEEMNQRNGQAIRSKEVEEHDGRNAV